MALFDCRRTLLVKKNLIIELPRYAEILLKFSEIIKRRDGKEKCIRIKFPPTRARGGDHWQIFYLRCTWSNFDVVLRYMQGWNKL